MRFLLLSMSLDLPTYFVVRCASSSGRNVDALKLRQKMHIFFTQSPLGTQKCINESFALPSCASCTPHLMVFTHKKTPLLIQFNGIIKAQLNDTAIHNCLYNYYNLENVNKRCIIIKCSEQTNQIKTTKEDTTIIVMMMAKSDRFAANVQHRSSWSTHVR